MTDSPNAASPLNATSVSNALHAAGVDIPQPTVLGVTESTNDEAIALAASGGPQWSMVVCDQQRAGRGRLGRSWETPPGQALLFSTVFRPPVAWAPSSWGWIPLIAGIAVCRAIEPHIAEPLAESVGLKWPNDVIVDGNAHDGSCGPRKLAGILAERRGNAVVVGIGINVDHIQSMLPIPAATSLALEGIHIPRSVLLADCLKSWISLWQRFEAAAGDAQASGTRDDYRRLCLTLGRRVRVEIAGDNVIGDATDIDAGGHLVVEGAFGSRRVSAGDVTHLRQ